MGILASTKLRCFVTRSELITASRRYNDASAAPNQGGIRVRAVRALTRTMPRTKADPSR
jgi:hypothetical protein